MKTPAIQIESLDSRSKCITRNGTYQISEVIADDVGDGMVNIAFVSKRLNRRLNAGATISASDMDRLAARWMQARGAKANGHFKELVKCVCDAADKLRKEI